MAGSQPTRSRGPRRHLLRPLVSATGLAVLASALGMLPVSSGTEPMLGAVALLLVAGNYGTSAGTAGTTGHAAHARFAARRAVGQAR